MSEEQKHILIVSQYFYPEQFRINDIALEWVNRGYKVTVLTGIPNYPEGKFYKGYSWFRKRNEKWNDIDIIRIPLIARGNNPIFLSLNYISFVISGFFWSLCTRLKADLVFIYEVSPMTQALPAVRYASRRKIPCDIYVTDLWPESVSVVLKTNNKLILGPIGHMVDRIYRKCRHIYTSSQSFIDKIASRGVDKKKIMFWPQYAEDCYKKVDYQDVGIPQDGLTNFLFAGNLGYAQGLGILPKVAVILKEKGVSVRFNILGSGRYEDVLKRTIEEKQVEEYFLFLGRKSTEEVPKYMASCDCALIILAKSDIFSMTIPAKTQSCMACGIPILVSADGEVQKIIRDAKCGFVGDSEDVEAFVDNIMQFKELSNKECEQMAFRAIEYYKKYFEKEKMIDIMDSMLWN